MIVNDATYIIILLSLVLSTDDKYIINASFQIIYTHNDDIYKDMMTNNLSKKNKVQK